MLKLSCHISIGERLQPFDFCTEIEVRSSYRNLTDTATITLPRQIRFEQDNIYLPDVELKDVVKPGDSVSIALGYDNELIEEFTGFVRAVHAELPIVIECEDAMYRLKRITVSKSWRSIQLRDMLREIVPTDIEIKTVDMQLGKFRIAKATVARVLSELRERYGLFSFFRNGVLHVGFAYSFAERNEHRYHFERNIVSSSLEYRERDHEPVEVRAISILSDNSRVEVTVGEPGGSSTTMHQYNIDDEETLRKLAEEFLERINTPRYQGTFTAFGSPSVQQGDIVDLQSSHYPDRQGRYLVEEVITTWGQSGFRRRIKPERYVG